MPEHRRHCSGSRDVVARAPAQADAPKSNREDAPSSSTPVSLFPSSWSGFYKKTLRERQDQLLRAFPEIFDLRPSSQRSLQSQEASFSPVSSVDVSTYVTPDTSPYSTPASLSCANESGDTHCATDADFGVRLVEKLEALAIREDDSECDHRYLFPIRGLDENIADNMIENCVGTIGLPVGLALNFIINGKPLIIPMAIEEPSVVAAVSGAAKTISAYHGFSATASERNIIIAQVALLDIPEEFIGTAVSKIIENKAAIINRGNQFCTSMVRRGGGVVDVNVRRLPSRRTNQSTACLLDRAPSEKSAEWLVVHLHIDVCDAMGANCANTVAEGVSDLLVSLTGGRAGLRILSNLCAERKTKASFRIPVSAMQYKSLPGKEVARRVLEAYEFAEIDPFRAVTHNKGIMNGVDAVLLATGQDWRSVEASSHVWACDGVRGTARSSSGYSPLTAYWVEENDQLKAAGKAGDECLMFCGELELPVSVGTAGGVVKTNPVYSYCLGLMNNPNAKELAMAVVCAGLASNFAALRALATEGIQRGHMSLHAKNIAIAAGCPTHAVSCVAHEMVESGRISFAAARSFIDALLKKGDKFDQVLRSVAAPLECTQM